MTMRLTKMALAGAVVAVMAATVPSLPVFGQANGKGDPGADAPKYRILPNSESQFAHELLRLSQVELIKAQEAASKGKPEENLWKAAELVATWDQVAKNRGDATTATAEYIAAVNSYLNATAEGIDGVWAMDHAKFIFGKLSESIINRMEYWGNNAKDRAALAPMADLAERLLKQAQLSLDATMHAAEAPGHPFDEAGYMRAYNATAEVEYYGAWGQYFKAMSMEPGTKDRRDLLSKAAEGLGKWADDENDNGVNNQALLLRGKARSEIGDKESLTKAVEDLNKANNAKAPGWVQYQAKYQIIVTRIRSRDFATAWKELEEFKKGLPQDVTAAMSTNMLGYRIAWAEAETKSGAEKLEGQKKAMGILADIIKSDSRFANLIYEQLVAQLPENVDPKSLLPMQQLAIAYSRSTGQKGDTPESRVQLQAAIDAALAVKNNANSTPAEKLEGTYLAAVCSALLNKLQDAASNAVEFVQKAPKDPRSKDLLNVAMAQLGELRQVAAKSNTPLNEDVKRLIGDALALSTGQFNDPRFRYAQGRNFEDNGNLVEAAKVYAKIDSSDPNYIDARFRLVGIATTRLQEATAKKIPPAEVGELANDLFKACSQFIELLDHPPKNMPAEILQKAPTYRAGILIAETTAALNPAVKRPEVALDRLGKLDKMQDKLTDAQKGAVLRYRIQAYQMNGQMDKIMPLLSGYAKSTGQNPIGVFQGLAVSTVQDIELAEKNGDTEQAKRLADFVVKLFDPIIEQELTDAKNASDPKEKETHKKNAYDLKQLKADMMIRSNDYKGAEELAKQLEAEDEKDIRSYMTEARAYYLKAQATKNAQDYKAAEDYFGRIVRKVTPGVDAYWECWLRIIECTEAQNGSAEEIKKTLNNLSASSGKFGGEKFREAFVKLANKYGVAVEGR
jgi:hypothetical protein